MEAASEISGGHPETYGGILGFLNRFSWTSPNPPLRPCSPAPSARTRGATRRRCSRPRARRSRGPGGDGARGDRAPRGRRDRNAAPALPHPPGAARGGLRRRGRRGMPLGHGARRRRALEALRGSFERFIGYLATKQALAGGLLKYVDRDAQLFPDQPRGDLHRGRAARRARPGDRRSYRRRGNRRGHPDGHRDRQDPGGRSAADRAHRADRPRRPALPPGAVGQAWTGDGVRSLPPTDPPGDRPPQSGQLLSRCSTSSRAGRATALGVDRAAAPWSAAFRCGCGPGRGVARATSTAAGRGGAGPAAVFNVVTSAARHPPLQR